MCLVIQTHKSETANSMEGEGSQGLVTLYSANPQRPPFIITSALTCLFLYNIQGQGRQLFNVIGTTVLTNMTLSNQNKRKSPQFVVRSHRQDSVDDMCRSKSSIRQHDEAHPNTAGNVLFYKRIAAVFPMIWTHLTMFSI